MNSEIAVLAKRVIDAYAADGKMIATAESCTGGLIAGALTSISGSSVVVDRGFVTYSNEAKADMLAVPAAMIAEHGAVSEPVARSMAEGALGRSRAACTVSVTGVAGPGGGSPEKPVGLVHFGLAQRDGETRHDARVFKNLDRDGVRTSTVLHALTMLLEASR